MYTTVRLYGEAGRVKITCFKNGKPSGKKGLKLPFDEFPPDEEGRLASSVSRTRSRIYELAACNPWQWFFTGTLNPEWSDVFDLSGFRKKLSQSIRDYRKATGHNVKYLLIPERHKSGAWHIHGLFNGLPVESLKHFTLDDTLPHKIRERIFMHDDVYGWEWYSKRFGFTTLTPIRSAAACAAYVTKYVTKDLLSNNLDSNAHSFYASIGLKGSDIIAEGLLNSEALPDNRFENDYVVSCFIDKDQLQKIVAKMERLD